jgi:hypothetical protein
MSLSLRRGVRFAPLAAPVVLTIVLAACGGDDGDGRVDVTIGPTSFQTRPPVTTLAPTPSLLAGETLPEGTRNPNSQQYEVQRGDFLFAIAEMFDVEIDSIVAINEWPEGIDHPLNPGDTIVIPPEALDAGAIRRESDDSDEADEGAEDVVDSIGGLGGNPGEECPDGSDRPVYEIQAGDIPGRVANQLDISLEDLTAVNEGNSAWSSFIVGAEIWLPCEDELDSQSTEG